LIWRCALAIVVGVILISVVQGREYGFQLGEVSGGASNITSICWFGASYSSLPGVPENAVKGDRIPRVMAVEVVIGR
jgi:hypothetical protein